ncbi:MAG: NUDIX domain-containing protein [Oscillospiraceae bacterium]|nr:NUDIX domain-containing protein [Oscillospiraceae bacterium]
MRLLFEMDTMDHAQCTHTFTHNSARSIIIKDGLAAMIHSLKYDYYKFPGGGIENGESPVEAMIRETREETGLIVIPSSVKEYGYVHRIQKSDRDATECFIQDNYYYLCQVRDVLAPQQLDDYEARESYRLAYVEPLVAIRTNYRVKNSPHHRLMFEREARVLEALIADGLLT